MTESINSWLDNLGLSQYADAFTSNAIDLDLLPELDRDTLSAIGVTLVGHQLRILKAVNAKRSNSGIDFSEEFHSQSRPTFSTRPTNTEPEAERRQLTVMFCDLVGSTELSQRLDPEDLRGVIRAYQDTCRIAIERYDGFVAKYMGDGVLAYFGYPLAHEDDAERAIRASLDLIEPVSKIAILDGTSAQVRVGIATGPVVVGDLIGEGTSLENAVVGETPNIAARLQGLADPDSIIVSPSTHKLAGGNFQFHDLGLQSLKGIDQPVRAWKVRGEAMPESRFDARYKQQLTNLVGREEELGILCSRWEQTNNGEGQVVLVAGEPGIGKSRLCESLISEFSDQLYTLLRYQCSPHHINSALYPIIHQIEQNSGIERTNSTDEKFDKLESFLNQSNQWPTDDTPLIATLLSLPCENRYPLLTLDQQEQKERTIRALARHIKGITPQRSVVLIFEDLHWVDPSTLELLDILIEMTQDLPILTLITFRPEFESAWIGQAHVTLLALNRISKRESLKMLTEIAPSKTLPENIVNEIMIKTDGVPLFIEEVTRTVLETASLTRSDSSNQSSIAIPGTLQDSLVARLDRLVIGKQVAQVSAAIGREFSKELITAICDLNQSELDTALEELVTTGLLFCHGSGQTTRYVFKHALLQDAAYNCLLLASRKKLHRQIAEALTRTSPDDFSLLAHHWERAEQFDNALSNWRKAAARAHKRYDGPEAIAQYLRAIDVINQQPITPETNSLLVETLLAAVENWVLWRNDSEQESTLRHIDRAIDFAIASGDAKSGSRLELYKGYHTSDESLLDSALAHAESSGDQELLAYVSYKYSDYLGKLARYEDSHKHVEQAIKSFAQLGQSVREAMALIIPGRCYSARAGRLNEAFQYTERARKIAEIQDDVWLDSYFVMECEPCLYKGLWNKTIEIAEQTLPLPREVGNWGGVAFASAWAASACLKLGRLEDAQQFLDEAQAVTDQRPNLEFPRAYIFGVLAQLQLARSETKNALASAKQAVEIADQGGFLLEHGAAYRALGQVFEVTDDRLDADAAFRHSLDILSNIQSRPELAQSLLAYGKFKRNDNPDEGMQLLYEALKLFREANATGWIDETLVAIG